MYSVKHILCIYTQLHARSKDTYCSFTNNCTFYSTLSSLTLHQNTHKYRSYIFRSSTILRELVQSLAKVTILLKHSVKLRRCILCGDVEACRETAYVLSVVQTAVCTRNSTHAVLRHAATSPHNIQRRNFTECFNRSVNLVRLCTSSLRMVQDRNMQER